MPESVTIVLPLPPKELSPNARVHWAVKSKAKAKYRKAARIATLMACGGGGIAHLWTHAVYRAAFYWPNLRRRDCDNAVASLKAATDGLVDAQLIAEDHWGVLAYLPPTVHLDRDNPRVEITVTRLLAAGETRQ